MQWVIEVNYALDNEDNIKDFQIRIIECESWHEYINIYINHNKNPTKTEFKNIFGYLPGPSLLETDVIEEKSYMSMDCFSCIIKGRYGMRTKRVAINYNRATDAYGGDSEKV